MEYKEYLKSQHWLNIRERILERDGNWCQDCHLHPAVEVHHLAYDRIWHENQSDLISLCIVCHGKRHGIRRFHRPDFHWMKLNTNYDSYEDMVDGEIERMIEKDD